LTLLIAVIVNCVGSLAFAQPKNKAELPLERLLPELENKVNLRVTEERIKGVRVMMNFVLKQYPAPPEPDQVAINYYQAKEDFATATMFEQGGDGSKILFELLEDPRALGIQHYHLRNRLALTAKCIDSLTPSIGNRTEVRCYMRIWQGLISSLENAIFRRGASKSSDDRQSASSEAFVLEAAENKMMGLIAGASGFEIEYFLRHTANCGVGEEFKAYLNKCERTRALDNKAGRQSK
jgi:hypothetical protein